MKENVCFFTGHRLISHDDVRAVQKALSCAVLDMVNRGVTEFIAGGALGFDMLAAETVAGIKSEYDGVRLRLYLPCPGYNYKWKEMQKSRMNKILSQADEVKNISARYDGECMKRRNAAMVNDAVYCIAWYRGITRSGTAQTVSMARRAGCRIRNLVLEPWLVK